MANDNETSFTADGSDRVYRLLTDEVGVRHIDSVIAIIKFLIKHNVDREQGAEAMSAVITNLWEGVENGDYDVERTEI